MERIAFNGNPNIGLLGFLTNEFLILGAGITVDEKHLKKALGVDILQTRIAGTDVVGLFLNGTEKKVLVPDILFDHELDALKQHLTVEVIKTRHTALGNNLIVTPQKILANRDMEKPVITKLGAKPFFFGDTHVIGVASAHNSQAMIVTPDATAQHIAFLEKELGLTVGIGTTNFGNKMVGAGILVNDTGMLVGTSTSGPEFMRLKEVFDF
ncbi:translation initiation factor IF-6 [archaeon CG10_big_fil_rev_8_21_14_0_10_43_11]|nr:MAG: translation initiation factor IF-6 [archaeon CG10_big_fil_rev_8_21_14_0_10_43_11]